MTPIELRSLIAILLTLLLASPLAVAADVKNQFSEAVEAHWNLDLDKAIQLYTNVLTEDVNHARVVL